MFGNRYFGPRYYGDRYWGEGAAAAPFTGEANDFHTYHVGDREAYLVDVRPPYRVPTRDAEDGS